jgi:hypothetical protein
MQGDKTQMKGQMSLDSHWEGKPWVASGKLGGQEAIREARSLGEYPLEDSDTLSDVSPLPSSRGTDPAKVAHAGQAPLAGPDLFSPWPTLK